MALFRTTEPDVEPILLAQAKAHLRIDHEGDDDLIEGLIRAARDEVETSCGLALIDQTWRLTLDRMPSTGRVLLRRYPVREVLSVTVFGSDGGVSVIDPSRYQLDASSRPARLHFAQPLGPGLAMNGIEIDFAAGFGEAGTDVPDLLKRAMLLLVAHWYEFRAAFSASQQPVSWPAGYDRLVAPYRSRRL